MWSWHFWSWGCSEWQEPRKGLLSCSDPGLGWWWAPQNTIWWKMGLQSSGLLHIWSGACLFCCHGVFAALELQCHSNLRASALFYLCTIVMSSAHGLWGSLPGAVTSLGFSAGEIQNKWNQGPGYAGYAAVLPRTEMLGMVFGSGVSFSFLPHPNCSISSLMGSR